MIKHGSFNKISYCEANYLFRSYTSNSEVEPLKIPISIGVWPHIQLIIKILPSDGDFQITALKTCLKDYLLLLKSNFVIEFIEHNILQLLGKDYLSALLPKIIIKFKVLIKLMPTLPCLGCDEAITLQILLERQWTIVKVY